MAGLERNETPNPLRENLQNLFFGFYLAAFAGFWYFRRRYKSAEQDFPSVLGEKILPRKRQLLMFGLALIVGLIVTESFSEITETGVFAIVTVWISSGLFLLFLAFHYLKTALQIK